MIAFRKQLELISLVENNYEHIEQLETLGNNYNLMKESNYAREYPSEYTLNQDQIKELEQIVETTKQSHYKDELKQSVFHINNVLPLHNLKQIPNFKKTYYEKISN
jgi:hypothetical protein